MSPRGRHQPKLMSGLLFTLLCLVHAAAPAQSIYLLPASQSLPAGTPQVSVEIWADFSAAATAGGGFDISYDFAQLDLVSGVMAPIGDPRHLRLPDISLGLFSSFGFGDPDCVSGPELVSTLTFDVIGSGRSTITPRDEAISIVGPFTACGSAMLQNVSYGEALIEIEPLVAESHASWGSVKARY